MGRERAFRELRLGVLIYFPLFFIKDSYREFVGLFHYAVESGFFVGSVVAGGGKIVSQILIIFITLGFGICNAGLEDIDKSETFMLYPLGDKIGKMWDIAGVSAGDE